QQSNFLIVGVFESFFDCFKLREVKLPGDQQKSCQMYVTLSKMALLKPIYIVKIGDCTIKARYKQAVIL
ncbi:MAG TPA: hypothetical protein VFQ73_10380, partial [Flavisolibacter sp.]|nr:hypothetical protein [Flavisolibacter sp.]